MADSGEHRPRRGPAPIASFDHDVSDESSPETKQTFQLPEIREDSSAAGSSVERLGVSGGETRARSHSTPGLATPAAPRIDISRASSSSHHDSRDSSPELALFAGSSDAPDHLGFREDGALDLRSSTEELAFLEPVPGEASAAPGAGAGAPAPGAAPSAAPPPPPAPDSRRHSRKDSQGSEAALLGIAGRSSRLSSIGSQCSAHSALSAYSHASQVSRLSVVSGTSRSPSPHKMLLETSFCGPKPIETDPEICAAAVEEHLLEKVHMQAPPISVAITPAAPTAVTAPSAPAPDARDRREVRTEVTVEAARPTRPAPAAEPPAVAVTAPADDKLEKETRNRARVEERRARSRERRDRSEPEVHKSRNQSKDVIRIKLKPDEEYEDDDDEEESEHTLVGAGAGARKPDTLALGAPRTARAPSAPCTDRIARSPSPQPHLPSRKSSFCSLFKSKETIASPDSPADALRRKKSLNEGRSRSRSKSRERSAPPSSGGKLRGSVLSLFKTPRRSAAASPSPSSRAASPGPTHVPAAVPPPPSMRGLKYYEDSRDGIIHIPLRTPPDEPEGVRAEEHREQVRPASAPCARPAPTPAPAKPIQRTVLPDGSIIIPLHSPTEREPPQDVSQQVSAVVEPPPPAPVPTSDRRQPELKQSETESEQTSRQGTTEVMSPPEAASPPSATKTEPFASADLPDPTTDNGTTRSRRKERLVFTTHVGSTEQVFSTQFSITKTPSVTSEISESFPSLQDEVRGSVGVLRDTHITSEPSEEAAPGVGSLASGASVLSGASGGAGDVSPGGARDSSESEGSSEAGGAARVAGDAEARGLVVQESFDEELPYVPTTLPQERSRALPMLPVRERGPHTQTTASVERPRSAATRGAGPPLAPPPPLPAPSAPPPPPHERLRIRLPRRASTATTTTTTTTTTAHATRSRTRSGSDGPSESRKTDWIDFSEVPERRKAARRIQTVPAAVASPSPSPDEPPAPLSYVEPDQCRCECHRTASPTQPHALSSPEEGEREGETVGEVPQLQLVVVARPFTADLGVREDAAS